MQQLSIDIEEFDEHTIKCEQPQSVQIKLWPHQLTMLNRCLQYENQQIKLGEFNNISGRRPVSADDSFRTQIGIIGDAVGSGKSHTILSLIMSDTHFNIDKTIKSYGSNKVVFSFNEHGRAVSVNLLVIPHNLVAQWQSYIKECCPNIRHVLIFKEKHLAAFVTSPETIVDYTLVVVTSSYYNKLANLLSSRSLKLQRVIFDEVDNINLPNCMSVESNFYWFVTASYVNLLYPRGFYRYDQALRKTICYAEGLKNSGFIKDIFTDLYNNLSIDFVKLLVLKNKDDYIKSSIHLPSLECVNVRCVTPMEISILNGYTDHEVIRSLNAGDIASAVRMLAPTAVTAEENIIALQISRFMKDIHNYNIRIEFTRNMDFDTEESRTFELDRLERRRAEVEGKVNGIKERIKNTNTCCICFDTIEVKTIVPCCSNTYCFKCLNIWLAKHQVCPLCKNVLTAKDLLVVGDDVDLAGTSASDANDDELSDNNDKYKNLEILIRTKLANNRKILIFSSYEMSFHSIASVMMKIGVKYKCLKGNDAQIRKIIHRYRNEDLNVLLVNARNFGTGLNLENTTDVVMFHKLNTEIEKQVIGRAQRYGRTTALNVWYLLHDNEQV
jgi:hypothetical protein